jgi:cytochrome c oxidase subunit 1
MTHSPPKEHNWDRVPTVHALDEFFHRKYEENEETGEITKVATAEELLAEQEANADQHIHMPSPSYWPVVLAFGLPVMAYGVIFERLLIAVGGAIMLLSMFGWALEPSVADDTDYDPPSGDDGSTKELATIG